jgi:glycosyltransferase involved in cell wall biosynthesis
MKIALVGSRGIPACYSGFETFYEQLGTRLAARGHEVTVFIRPHMLPDAPPVYKGVRLVPLPCIRTKHLETLSHTFLSTIYLLLHRHDIAYYCIVGNAPLAGIPRMRGTSTLLNVDGADWKREKWGRFARWYQHICEKIATLTPSAVIADAHGIQRRYEALYSYSSIFAPYGANVSRTTDASILETWGLEKDGYLLYVGRFVPENAIDLLIQAFSKTTTDKKLVIVGDAPYTDAYKQYLHQIADERVIFTGYAFGAAYEQLSSHAYAYIQPSGIDGTRPALLDQLGFGNCVLVRNSIVNMEVIGTHGLSFSADNGEEALTDAISTLCDSPDIVETYRRRATERIENYYNWEWVTDFYEDLFCRLLKRNPLRSYDDFLREQGKQR